MTYRIERCVKYFEPLTNKVYALDTAPTSSDSTGGGYPAGCEVIASYNGRLVLAGAKASPHLWYMSRQGDPFDWDYNQSDSQRAVAATGLDTGRISSPITAWISKDTYSIIGCTDQLWLLAGDPTQSGTLDVIVNGTGILSAESWCYGPKGEIVFMAQAGLYVMPAGNPPGFPEIVSREKLPIELANISTESNSVQLVWDNRFYGVHIYIVNKFGDVPQGHFFIDWRNLSIHPMSYSAVQEPLASLSYRPPVAAETSAIIGCRDGFIRRQVDDATTDDGTAVTSYVYIGPFTSKRARVAVDDISAILDDDSADVTWRIDHGKTVETAIATSGSVGGTFSAGLNDFQAADIGDVALFIYLQSTGVWAMEQVLANMSKHELRYA